MIASGIFVFIIMYLLDEFWFLGDLTPYKYIGLIPVVLDLLYYIIVFNLTAIILFLTDIRNSFAEIKNINFSEVNDENENNKDEGEKNN